MVQISSQNISLKGTVSLCDFFTVPLYPQYPGRHLGSSFCWSGVILIQRILLKILTTSGILYLKISVCLRNRLIFDVVSLFAYFYLAPSPNGRICMTSNAHIFIGSLSECALHEWKKSTLSTMPDAMSQKGLNGQDNNLTLLSFKMLFRSVRKKTANFVFFLLRFPMVSFCPAPAKRKLITILKMLRKMLFFSKPCPR